HPYHIDPDNAAQLPAANRRVAQGRATRPIQRKGLENPYQSNPMVAGLALVPSRLRYQRHPAVPAMGQRQGSG
nr:hypothetical protein [Tanacetum cinerariifolium]